MLSNQNLVPLQEGASAPTSAPLDRRAKRTREALVDALAQQIKATGDLTQVTVTEVSEAAGITRRTFYLHFKDIQDLVASVEDSLIAELEGYIGALAQTNLDELQQALAQFEPCPGSLELLGYVQKKGHILQALLGPGGDSAFAQKLKDCSYKSVYTRAKTGLNSLIPTNIFEYYLTFAISAEIGVLLRWLEQDMHEPKEMMARVMTALMFVRPGDLYGKKIDFPIPNLDDTQQLETLANCLL